jgi:hypothetical protein
MAPAPSPTQPVYNPLAGILSYLVPGLGQMYQGRFGKGLLFLVCLYGLFFYGMWLGSWKNVYLPQEAPDAPPPLNWSPARNVWARLQFAGQFWIGVAAWPAILQYKNIPVPINKDFQKAPDDRLLNDLQRDGDKTWDLGWVYTVIAGVLNVLVIYDAIAGPAFSRLTATAGPAPAVAAKEAVA